MASHSARNAWIVSVCLVILVLAGLVVSMYGDEIASFVSRALGN